MIEPTTSLEATLCAFMDEHVYPAERHYRAFIEQADNRWTPAPIMETLKQRAREAGLWNLWRPRDLGGRLSNREYAPLAEIMGRSLIGPEAFNCSARTRATWKCY